MNRGSIRVLGLAKTWVTRTVCYAAHNQRILAALQRRQAAIQTERPRHTRKRQRTSTFNTLLPKLGITTPPATGPPPPD